MRLLSALKRSGVQSQVLPKGMNLMSCSHWLGYTKKRTIPFPPPTPIEAISFVMDQRGMKQADLVPYIGSRSKVSEILRGKRTLSLSIDLIEPQNEIENEADELARKSLIPVQLWKSHPARKTGKLKDIVDLASKADIHKSIVAGRIRYERNNYRILWPHVGSGMVRKLFFA